MVRGATQRREVLQHHSVLGAGAFKGAADATYAGSGNEAYMLSGVPAFWRGLAALALLMPLWGRYVDDLGPLTVCLVIFRPGTQPAVIELAASCVEQRCVSTAAC